MSYTVRYSDPAKGNNPITIIDGTKNSQSTSLTLIGRNYPGYGQAIAENLVQLLENFASPTPPRNPIEGQLWFDTRDPNNKKLRINDGGISGAEWTPINGIFQQPTRPTRVKSGDIWVDTSLQQLKIFNGTDFTLIGPPTSGVSKTGSYPEVLVDTRGNEHTVIIQYVNDIPIEIISTTDFVPNPVIEGFGTIEAGVNVSTVNLGTLSSPNISKINGVADSAANLQLSIPTPQKVSADAFMRKDTDQRLTGTLSIAANSNALRIGSDPTFIIERVTARPDEARFLNTSHEGRFIFEIFGNNNQPIRMLSLNGPARTVTINNTVTDRLIVSGSVNISSSLTSQTLLVTSTSSVVDQVIGNSIQTMGGVGIGRSLMVGNTATIRGLLMVGPQPLTPIQPSSSDAIIVPSRDNLSDLGDPSLNWRTVYATEFKSGIVGSTATFFGRATEAISLSSQLTINIGGDFSTSITFRGNETSITSSLTATNALISSKPVSNNSSATDLLLVSKSADNSLYQVSKETLLEEINYGDSGVTTPEGSLVPLGTILPYSGDVAPAGWLICNGANINSGLQYANLRNLIQKKYDPTDTDFLLPNLSGTLMAGAVPINYIIKY